MCKDVWLHCMFVLLMSDASQLSASQTPWSIGACSIAVQPPVPSTRALSLNQRSQRPRLWVIGLGASALYFSQSSSFTLTLMTITHWPLQLLLWSLPLPSLLRRLLELAHTDLCKRSTSLKPAQNDTFNMIILLILFNLFYIYIFAPSRPRLLGSVVHATSRKWGRHWLPL